MTNNPPLMIKLVKKPVPRSSGLLNDLTVVSLEKWFLGKVASSSSTIKKIYELIKKITHILLYFFVLKLNWPDFCATWKTPAEIVKKVAIFRIFNS